jgi:hypothetical protein
MGGDMAENWPDPSPAFKNALWDVVLDAWEEVDHSEFYAATLVESLPRRMQMVIDSEGYWTSYWMAPIKQPFQGLRKRSKLLEKMLTQIILLKISKD